MPIATFLVKLAYDRKWIDDYYMSLAHRKLSGQCKIADPANVVCWTLLTNFI